MFDLLGDLGGVIQVVMICGSLLIGPISYHSFVIKAIRRIFLANTCQDDLFQSSHHENKAAEEKRLYCGYKPSDLPRALVKNIERHKHVHIEFNRNRLLYFQNLISNSFGGRLSCPCLGVKANKLNKLQKLYKKGEERFERELDVINIVRNLKNFRIMYKRYLIDQKKEFVVNHDQSNIIDINDTFDQNHLHCDKPQDNGEANYSESSMNTEHKDLQQVFNRNDKTANLRNALALALKKKILEMQRQKMSEEQRPIKKQLENINKKKTKKTKKRRPLTPSVSSLVDES